MVISNYVVAYVRSLSGPAVEKPPQDNHIILRRFLQLQDDLSKRAGAGLHSAALAATSRTRPVTEVSYLWNGQLLLAGHLPQLDRLIPRAVSSLWVQDSYPTQLAANLRELRLTFLWPLLPNGSHGQWPPDVPHIGRRTNGSNHRLRITTRVRSIFSSRKRSPARHEHKQFESPESRVESLKSKAACGRLVLRAPRSAPRPSRHRLLPWSRCW